MGDSRKDLVHGIPQFSGTGFDNWQFRVEKYLKSVKLLDIIKKDPPMEAAELTKFQEDDGKAAFLLTSFVHDDLLHLVRDKETSKEMWMSLESAYAKKSVSSQTFVRKQLAKLRMMEGSSVKDHLKTFEELIRQLKLAGAKLEENDIVSQLFATLPESFDPLVTALENLGEENLKLDVVRERLLAEELKKTDRAADSCQEKPAAFQGSKQKPGKFTGKCNRCQKKGHKAKDCRVKLKTDGRAEANAAAGGKAVAFMTGRCSQTKDEGAVSFKLDSGASDHLVNVKHCFADLTKLKHPVVINVAKDDQSLISRHSGTINGVNKEGNYISLKNVLFVPDLRANLLSVKKMAKADLDVTFTKKEAIMKQGRDLIARCPMRGDFYELDLRVDTVAANMCGAVTGNLWHRRLAHLGSKSLQTLAKHGMVTGIPEKPDKLDFCDVCVLGKQCREPFTGTRVRATRPLERVHSDVCGPITPAAWDDSRYFVTFIDDYTHFAVVYPIKKKSEVFQKFREYEAMASAALGHSISKLTVDQGREYCSNDQRDWYVSKGIQVEPTAAYTPQQNGVSERFNRTIVEKVRAMLIEAQTPKNLWNEAVLAAVYLTNRSPTTAVSDWKTPAEMWTGHKPDVSKLRVFGCKAFAWVSTAQRKKLDPKSKPAVMIGYAPNAYRLWNKEKKQLFLARDVKFDENSFPFATQIRDETPLVVAPYEFEDQDEEDVQTPEQSVQPDEPLVAQHDDILTDDEEGEVEDDGVEETGALPSQLDRGSNLEMETPRRSERERRLPGKLKEFLVGKIFTAAQSHSADVPHNVSDVLFDGSVGRDEAERSIFDVPEAYKEIAGRADEALWQQAVREELQSLADNHAWRLVRCPAGVVPLKSKWVFRIKPDEHGEPIRYKARLVAKGFQQKPGVDYNETYSPVAKLATIRTVLAVATHRRMHVHQLDVKTAFLYGELEEDVYMAIPEGVAAPPNFVCKLDRSLYGLKQSPRCWNNKLNDLLLDFGFTRSRHDYCLYTRIDDRGGVYIIIYVDDLLIAGDRLDLVKEIKRALSKKLQMTDCGVVNHFLGMKIRYDRATGCMYLAQEAAVDRVLTKFGMQDCNHVKTPMEKGCFLPPQAANPVSHPYRQLLGSLMYTMLCVRPDICYAVGYLGRFQVQPDEAHWQALKRVVRYVKGTKNLKLQYKQNDDAEALVGYADADWASDAEDRKSVSGFVFKVFGNTVSWASRKQQTVALSSCEAEYAALSAAASEGLWLHGILEDLKQVRPDTAFKVYEDNRGCIAMATNTESKRVKHIDVKHHFLRDHVAQGRLQIEAIDTANQIADTFTKPLEPGRFRELRTLLGLTDSGGVLE